MKEVRAKPCRSTVSRLQGLTQPEKPSREHSATLPLPGASVWCPRLSFGSPPIWNFSTILPKYSLANDRTGQHARPSEETEQVTLGIAYWSWLSGF